MKKRKKWILGALACLLLAAVCAVCIPAAARSVHAGVRQETADAMEDAAMRCAVQCYAVEGAYPENIGYLVENYGLSIDEEHYYVVYEVFASNVPPAIRFIEKNG